MMTLLLEDRREDEHRRLLSGTVDSEPHHTRLKPIGRDSSCKGAQITGPSVRDFREQAFPVNADMLLHQRCSVRMPLRVGSMEPLEGVSNLWMRVAPNPCPPDDPTQLRRIRQTRRKYWRYPIPSGPFSSCISSYGWTLGVQHEQYIAHESSHPRPSA